MFCIYYNRLNIRINAVQEKFYILHSIVLHSLMFSNASQTQHNENSVNLLLPALSRQISLHKFLLPLVTR